jgi:hypothetical protein
MREIMYERELFSNSKFGGLIDELIHLKKRNDFQKDVKFGENNCRWKMKMRIFYESKSDVVL